MGINRASTFTGFCARHDSALFAPLETDEFRCTPEQAHRLLYRPVAHELYKKIAQQRSTAVFRDIDRGRDYADQVIVQQWCDHRSLGTDAAIRHLAELKAMLDEELARQQYEKMRALIIDLDRTPDVLCAGVTQPDFSFDGVLLQDLSDTIRPALSVGFNILATSTGGMVVFVWHSEMGGPARRLLDSLIRLPVQEIPHAAIRFAFENFENLYLRPEWWEGLGRQHRERLTERMMSIVPFPARLEDDGMRAIAWQVMGLYELHDGILRPLSSTLASV
ncbi:hypothetical protein [Polyangium jinanense]|uniref:hypothetical protein n=1 Tax=Polyangium jinanense TaxID=2829994 RepID=UPI002340250C|nr:hypothetical protein [Polyangium jinanense]